MCDKHIDVISQMEAEDLTFDQIANARASQSVDYTVGPGQDKPLETP